MQQFSSFLICFLFAYTFKCIYYNHFILQRKSPQHGLYGFISEVKILLFQNQVHVAAKSQWLSSHNSVRQVSPSTQSTKVGRIMGEKQRSINRKPHSHQGSEIKTCYLHRCWIVWKFITLDLWGIGQWLCCLAKQHLIVLNIYCL